MTNKYLLLFLILFSSFSNFAQTYITNVTIVDVEKHKLVPNQTIVIHKDLISNIKNSKQLKIPTNATIIDGTGKYVSPGLTDAHLHFFQNGGLYTRPDVVDFRKDVPYQNEIDYTNQQMKKVLQRYIQNGITNVIDLGATNNLLKKRSLFKDQNDAPSIYMTGPLLGTYEPPVYSDLNNDDPFILGKTAEDGVKMVQELLPLHPDLIKIYYVVEREGSDIETTAYKYLPIVKTMIDEAHKNNLKVAVHASQRITAQLAVESGADFLVHSVEDEVLKDDFIALMKKNKTILSPTLIVNRGYVNTFGQTLELTDHELTKSDPYQLGTLLDLKHLSDTLLINGYKRWANSAKETSLITMDSISMVNLKKLSDAGVLIATGSDAGNIGTLHASSYLAELQAMHKSGMSNWQILTASTLNGAKILGKENEFGTVSIGKKANIILLDANPIDNINNLSKINRVINNGFVFNPDDLIKDGPTDLVQRQLNAYNLRNIDAFLKSYADDVEVYNYPNKLLFKGKEKMQKSYSHLFKDTPNLHSELVERIFKGNIVIDKVQVQIKDKLSEVVAIYHLENNKIKKVYFIQ